MNSNIQNGKISSRISFKKITKINLETILNLKVKPNQRTLVAPNAVSIAQAHFTRGTWYRAICLDEEPIGFVMLRDSTLKFKKINPKNPEIYLWRFMIDARYQGKGYGKRALELVIDHAKTRPDIKEITLHHQPSKGNAGDFYKKLGFKHTGKIHLGELEMKLKLD
jgi:diamine N-acetyltransferase